MKELKILAVVTFFTLVVYWGVEPFAHSQMHPHVAPADFEFKDLQKMTETISTKKGDATKGAETFMAAGCIGCHGLKSQGMPAPMDDATASASFGVVPPDLSSTGYLYDATFLAALIKEPTVALKVEHKFNETKLHPMTKFYGAGGDIDQEIADIVAYLNSIAPAKMTDAEVYDDACLRCHGMKYDGKIAPSEAEALAKYMGTTPPDLSMMIRAKGNAYLETFINNPQKHLEGTSMPRVGLTKATQQQVVDYMEKIGDRKKAERQDLGIKIMAFFALLSALAIMWKIKMWREVH